MESSQLHCKAFTKQQTQLHCMQNLPCPEIQRRRSTQGSMARLGLGGCRAYSEGGMYGRRGGVGTTSAKQSASVCGGSWQARDGTQLRLCAALGEDEDGANVFKLK
uniref:Uncharacterized protein n=1 Tax=Knipowitschia caucasica TaxID=637954 RepID=A0AAV2J0E0_KNICA